MKKFILPFLVVALIAGGCKKDSNSPAPTNIPPVDSTDPGDTVNVADVNSLKLTISKINTPIAPHNPGNYTVWFEMHNGAVYVGSPSNTGVVAQYFDKYDIASNTFTTLPVHEEVCACGFMSSLVSDRGSNIYYISNEAVKYSSDNNTWSEMPFPATAHDNHGETGAIYFDNKIFYIGGRDASNKVKYFDLPTQTWFNAPDFPYSTNRCDGVGIGNKLYVFGGENGKKKFSVYDKGTNSWTSMTDMPFETNFSYSTHYVAAVGKYIFIQQNNSINVYDTQADKWATTPIPNTANVNNVNLLSWNGKLYIAGKNNSNDFQLYQATIN